MAIIENKKDILVSDKENSYLSTWHCYGNLSEKKKRKTKNKILFLVEVLLRSLGSSWVT